MAAILEAVADYKQLADMEQLVNAGVKDERKKALKVTFSRMEGGGFIEATFVLEKRRVNGSLKDLAAEHVARQL